MPVRNSSSQRGKFTMLKGQTSVILGIVVGVGDVV
jgi:hypothetical protein